MIDYAIPLWGISHGFRRFTDGHDFQFSIFNFQFYLHRQELAYVVDDGVGVALVVADHHGLS
jgi:hypothetical protein